MTLNYLPSLETFCLQFLKFTQIEAWLLKFIPAKTTDIVSLIRTSKHKE